MAEITARVYGHGTDDIRIKDELMLEGEATHGLIKSRIAVDGEASSAVASAEPIVRVEHPQAMVTHEAVDVVISGLLR